MTTQQYIAKIRNKLQTLKQNNKPLAIAVASVHADQMERIFVDGKGSDNGRIGSYNTTKPLYVSPEISPKTFPKKGKTGETKFKNGRDHKTGFFNSYKEYRQKQGRQTSFVDLKLSGQLQKDISNSLTKVTPNKWVTGTKNSKNSDKLNGAEDKYGKIFSLSKPEKNDFKKVLQFEVIKFLR